MAASQGRQRPGAVAPPPEASGLRRPAGVTAARPRAGTGGDDAGWDGGLLAQFRHRLL